MICEHCKIKSECTVIAFHKPHPLTAHTCRIGDLEGQLKEKTKIERMLVDQTMGQEELLVELEEALANVEETLSHKQQEVHGGW